MRSGLGPRILDLEIASNNIISRQESNPFAFHCLEGFLFGVKNLHLQLIINMIDSLGLFKVQFLSSKRLKIMPEHERHSLCRVR